MADDQVIRALFRRLQNRVEALVIQVATLTVVSSGEGFRTFDTFADFAASDGNFRFAWCNNNVGTDEAGMMWTKVDSFTPAINSSDIQQVVSGIKFVRTYAREKI